MRRTSRHWHRAILKLSLLAYVATAMLAAPGLVLCIGPDDHCAIEFAPEVACGGCDDLVGAEHAPAPAPLANGEAPCPCVDLPLAAPATTAARMAAKAAGPSGVDLVAPPRSDALRTAVPPRAVRTSSHAAADATASVARLRSVVLHV